MGGVIILQAVGGLVVADVLKYADNILKCFGNAVSIVLSCLLSEIVLQEFSPDMLFAYGVIMVLLATSLYSLGLPQQVQRLLKGAKAQPDLPDLPARGASTPKCTPV